MKIKPKKSLGQNFLKNKLVVDEIMESANLTADDLVLEIGPGKGVLTEELAKKAGKVLAVELDKSLVEYLRNKFKGNEKIEVVEKDILKINLIDLKKFQNTKNEIQDKKYKVIANIPYYITSPIIRFFLENIFPPNEMILMVQKEVAERIIAGPGQHSILSLSVQYYAKPEILFTVAKDNFDPVPDVDSAVIKIVTSDKLTDEKETENFFRIVRAGFCAKRKTLANNLANSFHLSKDDIQEKLRSIGIAENARAQELDIEDWKKLSAMSI